MQRTIIRAVLVGIVAGLIVGVYHNIFTIPIIERAIVLEEERAAAALPAGAPTEDEPPLVSLGAQRVGLAVGMGVLGAVFGLVFAGTYGLLRWAIPDFKPIAMALIAGLLGFWALSFLVSVKFPFMPPGVGSEDSLVFRQGFQLLFYIMSALGVAGVILALNEINSGVESETTRHLLYALAGLVYCAILLAVHILARARQPGSRGCARWLISAVQQRISDRTPADLGIDGSRVRVPAEKRPTCHVRY